MSANPLRNPFKGGYTREIFRPLQYARCSMQILDITYTTRNIIRDIGLHLEYALKYILKWSSTLGNLRFNKLTLGVLNHKLFYKGLIDEEYYGALNLIVKTYNYSKHRVNMDDERDSSFTIGDSLIFYIVSRKIITSLLTPYYSKIYKDMKDINILQQFRINFHNKENFEFEIIT